VRSRAGEVDHPVGPQPVQPGPQRQAVTYHDHRLAARAGRIIEGCFDGGCHPGPRLALGFAAAAPHVLSGRPIVPLVGEAAFDFLAVQTFPSAQVDLSQAGIQDQRNTTRGDQARSRGSSPQVAGDDHGGIGGTHSVQFDANPAGSLDALTSPRRIQVGIGLTLEPSGRVPGGTPVPHRDEEPAAGHLNTSSGGPDSA
jgi:hypothetical protein